MTDDADYDPEADDWTPEEPFLLPEIPESLDVDPLLAAVLTSACFLERSDDDTVDPDAAVHVLEYVAFYLNRAAPDRRDRIAADVRRLADHARRNGWGDEPVSFLDHFLVSFGLEAGDDE